MKVVKGIGLFFIYPLLMLGIGFYAGVRTTHFFYPGERYMQSTESSRQENLTELLEQGDGKLFGDSTDYGVAGEPESAVDGEVREAAAASETLCVDTEYVLEETNILDDTVVETVGRLPDKYVGMNREQFLEVMETYEAAPPLSEQERGFVSLEVLSFSRKRVVVQMNYRYLQPSKCFYLAVYDNCVWVYLEDMKTVYIETDIRVDSLPEDLQRQIIQMMWVESEEELYNFLESYSS